MSTVTIITFLLLVAYAVVLLLIRRGVMTPTGKKPNERKFEIKFSVIIAARNEEDNIGDVLSDLAMQNFDRNDFEVIVVDDHSTDDTTTNSANFNDKLNLRIISLTDMHGKKGSLKVGIENANNPILAFTDADVHISPHWLSTISTYFELGADWLSGLVKTEITGSFFSIFQAYDQASLMAITHASFSLNNPGLASGANMAVKKEAYHDVGGFIYPPEDSSGDDIMLLDKVVAKQKYYLDFSDSKETIITTAPAQSMKSFLEQRKRWASNSFYAKSSFIKWTMLFGGLANLWFLILIALSFFYLQSFFLLLIFFLIKATFEGLAIHKTLRQMEQDEKFFYRFPVVALLHPFYIFTAAILGIFAPHNWKGRIKK